MRINYTMYGAGLTGGTRVVFEIANGLVERGHSVTITTLGNPSDANWFPLKAEANFLGQSVAARIVDRGLKKFPNIEIHPETELCRLANATPECDINVATFCLTAFPVFRSGKGIPFYHMQHYEPLFFKTPYSARRAEETYYLPLHKIANSSWLRDRLEKDHNLLGIPLVFPAIDHSIFYPRARKAPSNNKRIISLVRDITWKGFNDVISALRIVSRDRSDVELVCFGASLPKGDYADLNIKLYSGMINESLAQLYAESDVLLSASWYESFPLPPLEAMACALPVVTTPYGTEDYCFDRDNCLIAPPREPEQMASAILEILESKGLAEKLREKGLETAAKFTWQRTIDSVETIFRQHA